MSRAATPIRRAVLVAVLSICSAALPTAATGTAVAAEAGTSAQQTRDAFDWPFARNSIWNTPIGSGAEYVPAGLKPADEWYRSVTADPEHISLDPDDPLATLDVPGQPGNGAKVHVDPELAHDGSWNGCATLLAADGRSVWSGQPLRLTPGGTPTWRWTTQKEPMDLRGDGIAGCHGGSRMSGIGGSLRTGELDSSAPLRHALKLNLFCKKYCYRGDSQAASKRWPASTSDAYWATGYSGSLPALKMGALLALPPSTDLSGITHPKARKMAIAFRDFGGYLVDDTAWDVHAIDMDERVVESGEWPRRSDTAFHAQLQQVFQELAVVDNNSPTSVGGGGQSRAPLAPCFDEQPTCPGATSAGTVSAAAYTASNSTAASITPPVAPSVDPNGVPTASGPADVSLSDLEPTSVGNDWGPIERDVSNGERDTGDGGALTIGGHSYVRGLGVHADSDLTFALDGKFAHFTTVVGIDDEVGDRGSAVFEVWVDGVLQQQTVPLTGRDAPMRLGLSVWGARSLRLVVTGTEDGIDYDHADWADARLWVAEDQGDDQASATKQQEQTKERAEKPITPAKRSTPRPPPTATAAPSAAPEVSAAHEVGTAPEAGTALEASEPSPAPARAPAPSTAPEPSAARLAAVEAQRAAVADRVEAADGASAPSGGDPVQPAPVKPAPVKPAPVVPAPAASAPAASAPLVSAAAAAPARPAPVADSAGTASTPTAGSTAGAAPIARAVPRPRPVVPGPGVVRPAASLDSSAATRRPSGRIP